MYRDIARLAYMHFQKYAYSEICVLFYGNIIDIISI